MADITAIPSLGYYRLGTQTNPTVRLAESSNAGSTTLVFDNDITDEDGNMISKAVHMAFNVDGKILECYIAAGGFTTKKNATITGRALSSGGLDITTGDTDLDFDLPQGTPVYSVVSSFHPTIFQAALRAEIGSKILWNGVPTYTGSNVCHLERVFADTTARDAAITAPVNGMRCYITSSGTFQKYSGGAWADDATGTTANATTSVAGKVELATQAENDAGTATGGTGASITATPAINAVSVQNAKWTYGGASAVGTDSYAITLAPAITAYAIGQEFLFFADVANTGAATIDVNGLGAQSINKIAGGSVTALETNDIVAGFVYKIIYNGAYFILLSPTANTMTSAQKATLTAGSTSDASSLHRHPRTNGSGTKNVGTPTDTLNITHGLGTTPQWVKITAVMDGNLQVNGVQMARSDGEYAGTTYSTIYHSLQDTGAAVTINVSSTKLIYLLYTNSSGTGGKVIDATVTLTATEIQLAIGNTGEAADIYYKWECGV